MELKTALDKNSTIVSSIGGFWKFLGETGASAPSPATILVDGLSNTVGINSVVGTDDNPDVYWSTGKSYDFQYVVGSGPCTSSSIVSLKIDARSVNGNTAVVTIPITLDLTPAGGFPLYANPYTVLGSNLPGVSVTAKILANGTPLYYGGPTGNTPVGIQAVNDQISVVNSSTYIQLPSSSGNQLINAVVDYYSPWDINFSIEAKLGWTYNTGLNTEYNSYTWTNVSTVSPTTVLEHTMSIVSSIPLVSPTYRWTKNGITVASTPTLKTYNPPSGTEFICYITSADSVCTYDVTFTY